MSKMLRAGTDDEVYTSTGEEALVSDLFSGHVCIDSQGDLIRWCCGMLEYYSADLKVWCGMVVSSVTYPLYSTTNQPAEDSATKEEKVKFRNFGVKHTKKQVRLARNKLYKKISRTIFKMASKQLDKGYNQNFTDEAEVLIYLLAETACYGEFDLLDIMCGLESRYAEIKGKSLVE